MRSERSFYLKKDKRNLKSCCVRCVAKPAIAAGLKPRSGSMTGDYKRACGSVEREHGAAGCALPGLYVPVS